MKWADPRNSAERLTYTEEAPERILGNCGLMGVCDESGDRMSGELAVRSMASMHDRGMDWAVDSPGTGYTRISLKPSASISCTCLLYTSGSPHDILCVALGGRDHL